MEEGMSLWKKYKKWTVRGKNEKEIEKGIEIHNIYPWLEEWKISTLRYYLNPWKHWK